jgi:hypothetical protein
MAPEVHSALLMNTMSLDAAAVANVAAQAQHMANMNALAAAAVADGMLGYGRPGVSSGAGGVLAHPPSATSLVSYGSLVQQQQQQQHQQGQPGQQPGGGQWGMWPQGQQ